jgi:hypothetical protein
MEPIPRVNIAFLILFTNLADKPNQKEPIIAIEIEIVKYIFQYDFTLITPYLFNLGVLIEIINILYISK